jgi:hypothetical protein
MAETRGDVEGFPTPLRVGKRALGLGSRLIRAALEPQCDGALREGRERGMDSVRIRMKLDRVAFDALDNLGEHPCRHAEMAVPQFGSTARQIGAKLEFERVQPLGDPFQLVGASPRPRFVSPGELRVPDGVDDLEQLTRIPHLLAERARPLIVLSHLPRQVSLRDVERDTLEQESFELCPLAVGNLRRAPEKV